MALSDRAIDARRLANFIAARLVVADPGWHIASSDLAAAFNAYSSAGGRWSAQTLAGQLRRSGWLPPGVDKRRTRRPVPGGAAATQASRPDFLADQQLPPTYAAWHGLRFTTTEGRQHPNE